MTLWTNHRCAAQHAPLREKIYDQNLRLKIALCTTNLFDEEELIVFGVHEWTTSPSVRIAKTQAARVRCDVTIAPCVVTALAPPAEFAKPAFVNAATLHHTVGTEAFALLWQVRVHKLLLLDGH